MGYVLRALVVEQSQAASLAANLGSRPVGLSDGLALIPLTPEALTALGDPPTRVYAFLDDEPLPERLTKGIEEASKAGAVVYVEADIHGGRGQQASAVWEAGAIAFGPLVDPPETAPALPLPERAINRALRYIGVSVSGALDEFATVGLGRNRRTDEWLA